VRWRDTAQYIIVLPRFHAGFECFVKVCPKTIANMLGLNKVPVEDMPSYLRNKLTRILTFYCVELGKTQKVTF